MARKVTKLGRSVGTELFSRVSIPTYSGPDGTGYYIELTVQSSQVSSDLTNFPVYVDLSNMPGEFFANVQSDGGDIRVTESDGETRCPVELVNIDTGSSTGELHFLASSVLSSGNTTYRVYYGTIGTSNQPGAATTYGRNAVWADYEGVWHMQEDPSGSAPQMVDSTGKNDGTTNGLMTTGDSVAGVLAGQAIELDGVDDYVNMGSGVADVANNQVFTLSTWVRRNGNSGDQFGAVSGKVILASFLDEYTLLIRNNDNVFRGLIRDSDPDLAIAGAGVTSDAVWHYLAMTGNGSQIEAFFDGVSDGTASTAGVNTDTTGRDFVVGKSGLVTDPDSRRFKGTVDEVRVRNSELSSDWIAAEYTNQNTPTTFYTVGSQTTV